jgi:hypothetical protein
MLSADVKRIRDFMKQNRRDWHLKFDGRDLENVMRIFSDDFTVEVDCAGPGGFIEKKRVLKSCTPQEIFEIVGNRKI